VNYFNKFKLWYKNDDLNHKNLLLFYIFCMLCSIVTLITSLMLILGLYYCVQNVPDEILKNTFNFYVEDCGILYH